MIYEELIMPTSLDEMIAGKVAKAIQRLETSQLKCDPARQTRVAEFLESEKGAESTLAYQEAEKELVGVLSDAIGIAPRCYEQWSNRFIVLSRLFKLNGYSLEDELSETHDIYRDNPELLEDAIAKPANDKTADGRSISTEEAFGLFDQEKNCRKRYNTIMNDLKKIAAYYPVFRKLVFATQELLSGYDKSTNLSESVDLKYKITGYLVSAHRDLQRAAAVTSL